MTDWRRIIAGWNFFSRAKNPSVVARLSSIRFPLPGEPYDLIVTKFFLDCFRAEQLERIIAAVGRRAAPAANWLVADFQAAAHGLCRARSELILAIMYCFFRMTTRLSAQRLTPPDPFLEQAGFVLRCREQTDWALLHSDWWQRRGVE